MPNSEPADRISIDQRIAAFSGLSAATVYEAAGRIGSVDPTIKPLQRGVRLLGSALTVACCPKDNLMLHKALQIAKPGDVIVSTTGGYREAGYFGSLMATSGMARQIAGLAIDGCVRDSADILQIGFSVFCSGTCIRGTDKRRLGSINQPIHFGGLDVFPGDLVVGDDDGLVILPADKLEAVLAAARRREQKEKTKAAALKSGKTSMELNKLDAVYDSLERTR